MREEKWSAGWLESVDVSMDLYMGVGVGVGVGGIILEESALGRVINKLI